MGTYFTETISFRIRSLFGKKIAAGGIDETKYNNAYYCAFNRCATVYGTLTIRW